VSAALQQPQLLGLPEVRRLTVLLLLLLLLLLLVCCACDVCVLFGLV
jgi:hypothetical protein